MKKEINAGIIGLGMGVHHLRNYTNTRANVLAICDVNEERLAKVKADYGIPHAFTSVEKMLEMKELDVVSVALPNYLHCPISVMASQAGKHVMCEKPMAMNAREGRKMALAAKESGMKFMMHFNSRFSPEAQILKEYADSGILGDVYYARSVWNRRRGMPGLGGWFTTRKFSGGGPLIDLGVHRLDLALWLMGNHNAVSVSGFTHDKLAQDLACAAGKTTDIEDFAAGFVRLDNGAVLALEASWATNTERSEEMSTTVLGSKGSLYQGNVGESYVMEAKVFVSRYGCVEVVSPKGYQPKYASAQQHFVDCIIDNKEPLATAEHGVRVMEILDALYESAIKGHAVKVRKQALA
ncbi:MAG TPA: Gfo/Idh/MocA family oxidoreductase [Planctomycetota bacterium]|nr:Gfo/Idh/MocA family oxidoreductase [Planctomycetota bacterium]